VTPAAPLVELSARLLDLATTAPVNPVQRDHANDDRGAENEAGNDDGLHGGELASQFGLEGIEGRRIGSVSRSGKGRNGGH